MKLRNKKTGEILDLSVGFIKDTYNGDFIQIKSEAISYKEGYLYDSLAELNEDWEDYTPPEPLIKDEKIRKAVRAWAEANDINRVWHECATCWLRGNGLEIFFEELELEQGNYTIIELCGEEEE